MRFYSILGIATLCFHLQKKVACLHLMTLKLSDALLHASMLVWLIILSKDSLNSKYKNHLPLHSSICLFLTLISFENSIMTTCQ